jgi:hypothetical protein
MLKIRLLYPNTRGGRRRFFRAFALASAKRKKERESAKKKEREKKRKRRARKKKSANSRFFLNPKWKSGFRAQSRSAGGKAKVFSEMYSSVC